MPLNPPQPAKWWISSWNLRRRASRLKQNCEHSARIASKTSKHSEQTELWINRRFWAITQTLKSQGACPTLQDLVFEKVPGSHNRTHAESAPTRTCRKRRDTRMRAQACSASHTSKRGGPPADWDNTTSTTASLVAFQTQTQNRSVLATQFPKSQPCPRW